MFSIGKCVLLLVELIRLLLLPAESVAFVTNTVACYYPPLVDVNITKFIDIVYTVHKFMFVFASRKYYPLIAGVSLAAS
jgi:hypothetical protein